MRILYLSILTFKMATTIYPVVFSINKYKPTHLNLDLNIYISESLNIDLENKQMFSFKKN